jgi:hypothetical protein
MQWREIRQSGEVLDRIGEIWAAEEKLPLWFRNASKAWTAAEEDFGQFVRSCSEAWGLFDGAGELCVVIYIEGPVAPAINIHLSVLRKVPARELLGQLAALRNATFRRGVRSIRGWVLGKNRSLKGLLTASGFTDTELRLDHGESHGRTLRWHLMEARRG